MAYFAISVILSIIALCEKGLQIVRMMIEWTQRQQMLQKGEHDERKESKGTACRGNVDSDVCQQHCGRGSCTRK